MTHIARNEWRKPLLILLLSLASVALFAVRANADERLSVTVTPPLFQLTIGPGESWASTLKVVNNNTYDITYYAHVVDMEANGEEGRSKFIPLINLPQDAGYKASTLAGWVTIPSGSFTVAQGKSVDIPFSVEIPKNAEPGGHYAAILVGTEPNGLTMTGSMMKISSYVSSLLFVKIKGDIVESGRIREFRTEKSLYQVPEADFLLRFENTGNTHLKPQGDISIYNMWGKERGSVLINQDTNFGNVLPKSIRKFQFSWAGEQSVFDVGRYSAVVTLTYGEDGKKNIVGTTYFWVIPVVPVAIGTGLCLLFIIILFWLIRRYVRRALMLERMRLGVPAESRVPVRQPVIETIIQPIREGVIDLRNIANAGTAHTPAPQIRVSNVPPRHSASRTPYQQSLTPGQFLSKYKLFFLFVLVVIVSTFGIWRYFDKVLVAGRNFEIRDVKVEVESP